MLTLSVTKRFTWDMAHILEHHNGLCKNVHGHTYMLDVTVEGPISKSRSSSGMVIDFKDLKAIVNKYVVDKLDHSFAYNVSNSYSDEIGKYLESKGLKTYPFLMRTTAENMARYMFSVINTELRKTSSTKNLKCTRVVLWETPTSFATAEK